MSKTAKWTKRVPAVPVVMLLPAILGMFAMFLLPLLYLFRMSLNRGSPSGYIEPAITSDMYVRYLTDDYYWKMALDTGKLGLIVTLLTIVVSYPIALMLVRTESRFKGLLTALAIAPLLTSAVVRTYGWIVILGPHGVVNSTIQAFAPESVPLRLINNEIGVYVSLTQIMMPYMILALLTGFGRLDNNLEQAAASLGANGWQRFWRVTWPLSLPGVLTGALLVFVLTISSFITPRLVGGGRVFLLATEIYDQAVVTLNWPFAAAMSFILLVLFGAIIVVYQAMMKKLGDA